MKENNRGKGGWRKKEEGRKKKDEYIQPSLDVAKHASFSLPEPSSLSPITAFILQAVDCLR